MQRRTGSKAAPRGTLAAGPALPRPGRLLRSCAGAASGDLASVVGFAMLLALVFLPVLVQARAKARQVSCVSNLKQVTLALLMYSQDYDEKDAPSRVPLPIGATSSWTADETGRLIAGHEAAGQMFWAELIQPYVRSRTIFKCPANHAAFAGGGDLQSDDDLDFRGYGGQNSYAINAYMARPGWGVGMAEIDQPADTFYIVDGRYYTALPMNACALAGDENRTDRPLLDPSAGPNGSYWKNIGDSYLFRYRLGEPSFIEARKLGRERHQGMVNVSFTDGHVKSRPYEVAADELWWWDPYKAGCAGGK